MDRTEGTRRLLVAKVNYEVESEDEQSERTRLKVKHGRVWSTNELTQDFEVLVFMAPFVIVREKVTGQKGTLMFQHHPRFYFSFTAG